MSNTMRIVAGLDIGNGYVKGVVWRHGREQTKVDMPSCVAIVTNSHDIKADVVSEVSDLIYNRLDAKFDSPMISETHRCYFGHRAIQYNRNLKEFDISGHESKALQELSPMFILGCIAAKAVQEYYGMYQRVPSDEILDVEAVVAIALPIGEYRDYRKSYADAFRKDTHMVSIYNFEDIVRVNIRFRQVVVFAEGAAAQYAIATLGEESMDAMLRDTRAMGIPLEGITSSDIRAAESTVGIDIGEGTVNFPVFANGQFNPDASRSFNKGYGTVLSGVLDRLKSKYPFDTRKALADYLAQKPTALKRAMYSKVMDVVNEEIEPFVMEVQNEFAKVIRDVGVYTEVIYVYGGGAAAVRDALYPKLVETVKKFSGGENSALPVIYMDSKDSRWLNMNGLAIIAEAQADRVFG